MCTDKLGTSAPQTHGSSPVCSGGGSCHQHWLSQDCLSRCMNWINLSRFFSLSDPSGGLGSVSRWSFAQLCFTVGVLLFLLDILFAWLGDNYNPSETSPMCDACKLQINSSLYNISLPSHEMPRRTKIKKKKKAILENAGTKMGFPVFFKQKKNLF